MKPSIRLLVLFVMLTQLDRVRPTTTKEIDMCKWKPIIRNGKLKGGIGSGTFHRLGYTPNMETCVDLCCNMDVCGVAFKNKDDCFGIECNSDESCESIPADSSDIPVEIAHVRAGHKSANLTDMTMAGQCRASPIYKEVTLKGGINAGTYKDVGGVSTMEECQTKCCEFPACDLAFMLAGSCYLVGCTDQKQCAMQPAKESKFHPMISYVTRWNNEGVKHTVLLQEKGVQHTCPKMNSLVKVTLKGGLQAGDFTDVGKVSNLGQCYDICCQQEKCDLAFMLGQNCFSVQCKDKKLCGTTPAQPSIFNPQIAYVLKRERVGVTKSGIAKLTNMGVSGECPVTKILDKMTLKGGVDAGAYKDHGKVKDMEVCRRICCEMTECHLAFMLGMNCFSVKCASVDTCRAQKAKPSAYYPKISYIRKVGTNELLRSIIQPVPIQNQTATPASSLGLLSSPGVNAGVAAGITKVDDTASGSTGGTVGGFNTFSPQVQQPNVQQQNAVVVPIPKPSAAPVVSLAQSKSLLSSPQGVAATLNKIAPINSEPVVKTINSQPAVKPINSEPVLNSEQPGQVTKETEVKAEVPTSIPGSVSITNTTAQPTLASSVTSTSTNAQRPQNTAASENVNNTSTANVDPTFKDEELVNALEAAENETVYRNSNIMPINQEKCIPGILKSNVTLKGGRKSGEFIEIKNLKDMKSCVQRCCEDRDKKCNLAFMLGDTCYSVSCKNKDLCRTIPAPPTKFNPLVQYVRGLDEEPMASTTATTTVAEKPVDISSLDTLNPTPAEAEEKVTKVETKPKPKPKKSCVSQPVVKSKSIRGGKKAGKFKIFKDIKDIDACISKCCSLKMQCDVAYMEGGKCYSIQCFKKSACTAIDLRDTDINPKFAYMDHFLEKVDEEEAEIDTTDLDIAEDSACLNVEIASNKTLKGGTRAGKFRPMGKMKNMKTCISSCCDRPDCDVAYLLNGHCYAVECSDGKLCQATGEPSRTGDSVQLAYMNKAGLGEKQRDFMVVYIIVGSLAFAATLGGLIWVVFAFSRKQRIKKSHKRLLDGDDEEEPLDEILHKRTSHTRYRQPRY